MRHLLNLALGYYLIPSFTEWDLALSALLELVLLLREIARDLES